MTRVCDAGAIEDLAPLPGRPFLLAGALRFERPAPIRAIDARNATLTTAWPRPGAVRADLGNYPDCPGPPDPSRLSTTGVALQPLPSGPALFYAVNEGDRRAIEVFEVRPAVTADDPAPPQLDWVGCVPMPSGTNANAVTPLEGRAMAIVSMDDGSVDRMARHAAGEALGSVWTWRPDGGLRRLAVPPLRDGNGIAASSDHRWLYVSAWSGAHLLRISADGHDAPTVPWTTREASGSRTAATDGFSPCPQRRAEPARPVSEAVRFQPAPPARRDPRASASAAPRAGPHAGAPGPRRPRGPDIAAPVPPGPAATDSHGTCS